jgi:hypothetical protein
MVAQLLRLVLQTDPSIEGSALMSRYPGGGGAQDHLQLIL